MTPAQRSAVYSATPVLASLLVVFGVVTEEQAATLAAAAVATLGVVVAFVHRPTRRV